MFCPICRGTGYVTVTIAVVHDGGYLPDYIVVACDCNPAPTDEDAPDWSLRWDANGNCYPDKRVAYDGPGVRFVLSIDGGYYELDGYDEEYDDSQVPGTAFEDFHRFNGARYAGI